jgi:deazaflavin-dependent oxidoreductase (nitroreductase family)
MKIPNKVRYLNKKFTNHLMMRIAGKKRSPIVIIEHVGRVSGRVYQVPLMAAAYKDGFMFALTYGLQVDWYQNILYSREGKLTVNGRVVHLIDPEPVLKETGQKAFGQPFSTILRWIDIRDFFFMQAKETTDKATTNEY